MKKQLIYFLLALTAVCLGACNNDDEIDTAHSIFSTEPVETTTHIPTTSISCIA